MDSKYSRREFIRGKQDEIAMLERDLAAKRADLADAEAAEAAENSREAVKFSDDPHTVPKKAAEKK